ncbi:unnamed protein product [Oikopleura dioica]|uniref:Uncharacterized protein n=1 Tax=Oikopleura dioica TaxID=34765 RepID=E4X7Q6_OIKDI|nr:unnamed protein product [Oikopleura dioica]
MIWGNKLGRLDKGRRGFSHLPIYSQDYRVFLRGLHYQRRRWTCFLLLVIVVQIGVIYYLMTQTTLFREIDRAIKEPEHKLDLNSIVESVNLPKLPTSFARLTNKK